MSNPSTPTSISERIRPQYWLAIILIGALAVGVIAFYICSFLATRELRDMAQVPNGELQWLRREFHLSDAQFKNIEGLQTAYAPVCNQMCTKIMEANSKVDRLVSENREVTPELEAAIREAGSVQQDCHKQMLAHIYRVSAQMDPEEGQRYLRMMRSRVVQPGLSSDTAIRAATE
jgi:hypothetical protein